jgi:hypothetical protein
MRRSKPLARWQPSGGGARRTVGPHACDTRAARGAPRALGVVGVHATRKLGTDSKTHFGSGALEKFAGIPAFSCGCTN